MQLIIPTAGQDSSVLFIHAPYPGQLKFQAQPSSMLMAAGPYARHLASDGRLAELGYLNPESATDSFYADLEQLVRTGEVRAVCITTSTAAIGEAIRIVETVRRVQTRDLLVVAGGSHEDDVEEKMAHRLAGVDISISGDAEHFLAAVLRAHEVWPERRSKKLFLNRLLPLLTGLPATAGRVRVSSREWGKAGGVSFDGGIAEADELLRRPWIDQKNRFSVFEAEETLCFMVSRGCPYGRCTFCAEAVLGPGRQSTVSSFEPLLEVVDVHPGAALYFQDSIFPNTESVRTELLPLLKSTGREWGCQVYLRTVSRGFLELLAAHGCRYIYTGLESAVGEITAAAGKPGLTRELARQRFSWMADLGLTAGISLMFGVMALDGRCLETPATVAETVAFALELAASDLDVVGIYPNVQTVLPGTALAEGLAQSGLDLDFYRMPRASCFGGLEDGAVGYNFATLEGGRESEQRAALISAIAAASSSLSSMTHCART